MVLDVNMPRLSGLLAHLHDPPLVVLVTAGLYDDQGLAQGRKFT